MRTRIALVALTAAAAVAGCAQDKQWMKVGQPYTTEEFRRDYADCSKGGKLDETCLRSRGWVSVTPGKTETKEPENLRRTPGGGSGRY